jgi:hypothetical protein
VKLLLALVLALSPCPHPARHASPRAAFRRAHPCPGGVDRGSVRRCRGYVIDHIVSLACCGPDLPCNLQWQSVREAKAKDRWELRCEAAAARARNSCGIAAAGGS